MKPTRRFSAAIGVAGLALGVGCSRVSEWQDLGPGCAEPITDVHLAAGQPPVDWDTRTLQLGWRPSACAAGYWIYARDALHNPTWTLLREVPATDAATAATCQLPPSFDLLPDDGRQTPFAGLAITLAVVALGWAVEAAPPEAMLTVRDQVAPRVIEVWQDGSGRNDGASSSEVVLGVSFSERIDMVASPGATLDVVEAGGDPSFHLNAADGHWQWNADGTGAYVLALAPGRDATGDRFRLTFAGLADESGNAAGLLRTDEATILPAGAHFDFEASDEGWSSPDGGWQHERLSTGSHSGQYVWGLALTARTEPWNTALLSPELLVPAHATLEYWAHWYLPTSDERSVVQLVTTDSTITLWTGGNHPPAGYFPYRFDLSPSARRRIRLRFAFTSPGSVGYYLLDDVSLFSDPTRSQRNSLTPRTHVFIRRQHGTSPGQERMEARDDQVGQRRE